MTPVRARTLALLVGAATLGLEVVAARVAALNVGVSLYSWTGVIGGTLAGLAAGAWLGGRRADRLACSRSAAYGTAGGFTSPALGGAVRRLVLGSAIYASLAVTLLSTPAVLATLARLGRLGQLAAVVVLVGLVPALLLGAVGPLLARAAVVSRATDGRAIGGLGAATNLGGLAGAALAGLVLIPTVGVRGSALVLAALLLAAATGGRGQAPPLQQAGVGGLAGAALVGALLVAMAVGLPRVCQVESAYQCLRVDESEPLDGHPVRTLYLDNLPHADVAIDQPLLLAHDYLVPAAEMAGYVASRERPLRALVIGGGGYSLPRYLAAAYPDAEITVLELDPAVTAMARARLNLSLSPPFGIVHGDARETLETLPPDRRYDLIVLDAFSDVMVPYHLVTAEIDRRIAARLAPDGRYVALVHDLPLGRLLPAATRTMREVFGAVDVLAAGPGVGWRRPVRRTWSVVAGVTELDAERIDALTHPTPNGPFPILSEVMPSELLDDLLRRPGPARLTDDYTPVEVLAAPLFD